MTIRELVGMVRQYGLDPDAELYMRPLLKDKERKVETVSIDNGKMILSASKPKNKK